jgi:putative MATE family efflux protein
MEIDTTSRGLWRLSGPLIMAGVSETIIDLTDVAFLGHYGETELGAVGLAEAVYDLAIFATLGLVDAVQVLVARRAGQGDRRGLGRAFNQGFYLIALVSILLTLVIRYAWPVISGLVFASSEVDAAVAGFLRIFAFGVFFHTMNLTYSALFVGISRTRVLIGAAVVLAATNIILDYGLIFGHFGLPELGIEGAAIASLAAEIATFVFLTGYALTRIDWRSYGLFAFGAWDGRLARVLTGLAIPVSLETLVEAARWFVFFLIMEQIGESALAASTVIAMCYAVMQLPADGISEAGCSMVSNLIGQDRSQAIGGLMRRAIAMTYIITLPMLILALFWPKELLALFTPTPEIIDISINGLWVIVLAVLIAVPGEMATSAVIGTGDTSVTLAIEVVGSSVALIVAYCAAFVFDMPLEYIWMSAPASWIVSLALAAYWLRSGRWRRLYL